MPRSDVTVYRWLLALSALALAAGLAWLFLLRFEAGDIYPAYSSFRADPIGAKALYEAMRALPGMSVRRNVEPLESMAVSRGSTFLLLGTRAEQVEHWPDPGATVLEGIAAAGGRVVITFYPQSPDRADSFPAWPAEGRSGGDSDEAADRAGDAGGSKREGSSNGAAGSDAADAKHRADEPSDEEHDTDETPWMTGVSLGKRWGFDLQCAENAGIAQRVSSEPGAAGLPQSIGWHSPLHLGTLGRGWRTLYTCEGKPVVAEKPFGRGTLILATDSFFVSNEAMRAHREPALLVRLLGTRPSVVFDETHHGVEATPGMLQLARRNSLQGVYGAILVLAVLLVWRQAASFVPPLPDRAAGAGDTARPERGEASAGRRAAEAGRGAASGLTHLLRRSIPPSELLNACVAEWSRGAAGRGRPHEEQARRLNDIRERERDLPPGKRNLVRAYLDMCDVLSKRKPKRG